MDADVRADTENERGAVALPWVTARAEGVTALETRELLAMVLAGRTGAARARRWAGALLDRVDAWRLPGLGVAELGALTGMDTESATFLLAALELGGRAARPPYVARVRLTSPAMVAAMVGPRMVGLPRERVVVIALDRGRRLLATATVAEGWAEGCPVDPREVFRAGVVERAHGVVLVHNHPSGDPQPSASDRELTTRLAAAGRTLGMPLVDHVVVAAGGYASLGAEGLCP